MSGDSIVVGSNLLSGAIGSVQTYLAFAGELNSHRECTLKGGWA